MSNLQKEIDRLYTLMESFSALAKSVGAMAMMTDAEKQPALDDLLSQLD